MERSPSATARGASTDLDLFDKALIEMGRFYDIGPVDCSYQIVADREDRADATRRRRRLAGIAIGP